MLFQVKLAVKGATASTMAWLGGSAPCSTASIPGSSPAACWMSCRCPPRPAPPALGGIDANKPRSRAVLAALALAIAPGGFTVADFAAKVRDMTGQPGYIIRNAACDLRKLRGKRLADKPGRTRRHFISPGTARIISALLTLREQVIAPLLAGVAPQSWGITRSPTRSADPPDAPPLDRHQPALPGTAPGDDGPVRRYRHRLRLKHRQRQHFVDPVPSSG
jgi:hypothetical protein